MMNRSEEKFYNLFALHFCSQSLPKIEIREQAGTEFSRETKGECWNCSFNHGSLCTSRIHSSSLQLLIIKICHLNRVFNFVLALLLSSEIWYKYNYNQKLLLLSWYKILFIFNYFNKCKLWCSIFLFHLI